MITSSSGVTRLAPTRMICVTFQKPGIHQYPVAPDDVQYLRSPHRHLFKFKVSIQVWHDDRELEFHQFLNWLESLYAGEQSLTLNNSSCEMISDALAAKIQERYSNRGLEIEVWEDGECGSRSTYHPALREGCGISVQDTASVGLPPTTPTIFKAGTGIDISYPLALLVPLDLNGKGLRSRPLIPSGFQLSQFDTMDEVYNFLETQGVSQMAFLLAFQAIDKKIGAATVDIRNYLTEAGLNDTSSETSAVPACVGHSGGKDSVLVRALVDFAGYSHLPSVHNPKRTGPNAVCSTTRSFLYAQPSPVIQAPGDSLKKFGFKVQVDGSRRFEADRGNGRSTDFVSDGKQLNRAEMPMFVERGLFDMSFLYPIVDWTDAEVWAAIAYMDLSVSLEYKEIE